MANYFVASGGSNTSPYDTWAKAATSLATALAAATATGDRVIVQYDAVPSGDSGAASSVTYTFAANIALISASNDGGSAYTPTAMGESYWIGTSTSGPIHVFLAGAYNVYMYGITLRSGGGNSNAAITLGTSDGAHYEMEDCCLWQASTASNQILRLSATGNSHNTFARLTRPTFRFGHTSHSIVAACAEVVIEGGQISPSGSTPSTLFTVSSVVASGSVYMEGCDWSPVTGTLIGSHTNGPKNYVFVTCRLGSGVTVLATQTPANKSSARAWLYDCAAGDAHYHIQYHDAFGSLTVDTGIYANDGAQYDGTNRCSWKIVTTANCSYFTPFVSPWFDVYHSGTSAVTPSIEFLRDGSTTAYQDDEVWGEWAYKGTAGSTQTTLINDRKALEAAAANQDAGVGTSGWTGENATAWSGKLTGASITPAEIGHIRGRVCVGEPSITVYVDPQTRLA